MGVTSGGEPSAGVGPYGSHAQTAAGLLQLLHTVSGLDLLLVTRVDPWSTPSTSPPPSVAHRCCGARCCDGRSPRAPMSTGAAPAVAPCLAAVPAYADAPNLKGSGLNCYVGVAIHRGDGHLYGSVCGFGRAPRDVTMHALLPSFQTAARLLGGVLAAIDAAEERLAEIRADHAHQLSDALVDPITGLLNRTGLEQAIAREQARHQRYGHTVAVVVCDVDGLKAVNDQHGHGAGDALLRRVGDRLRSTARASDVLGRLGGDEFLLLLPGEHHDGPALTRLHAVLADLPVSIGAADTGSTSASPLPACTPTGPCTGTRSHPAAPDPPSGLARTTTTGHPAWAVHCVLTEPRRSPTNPP